MTKSLILFFIILSNVFCAKKTIQNLRFQNEYCHQNKTCNLKSFSLSTYNSLDSKQIGVFKNSYMEGYYEVKDPKYVQDFAVVQYIKGCIFEEYWHDNENVRLRNDGVIRDFFGKKVIFNHPNYVIDSFDDDPIYASFSEGNHRHGLYSIKLNDSKSIIFDDSKFHKSLINIANNNKKKIYFSDMPTGSSYTETMILEGTNKGKISKYTRNASMVFTTCIFKTSDIPRNLSPQNTDTSKAIKCFNWSNSHIYNSNKKLFYTNNNVHSKCFK